MYIYIPNCNFGAKGVYFITDNGNVYVRLNFDISRNKIGDCKRIEISTVLSMMKFC